MTTEYQEAIEGWEDYATSLDRHVDYLETRGEYAGAWREKAKTSRRAAESLRLSATTGVSHCACCLKPASNHR